MMGFVFADVEPLAKIIRRTPTPCRVYLHEPFVVALAQFVQGLLSCFCEVRKVVLEIVASKANARGLSESHRYAPFQSYLIGIATPPQAIEGVQSVIDFGGSEVNEKSPMEFASGCGSQSRSSIERPCKRDKTTLRIQLSCDTNMPICGVNPLRGPKTQRGSAAGSCWAKMLIKLFSRTRVQCDEYEKLFQSHKFS